MTGRATTWQHDFKAWVTRSAASIDDIVDAGIRRLRERHGYVGIPQIQPYVGFASRDNIHLHGRVLTNPPIDADFKKDRWWNNLANSMRRFGSDEVPNVKVTAKINGLSESALTDADGYFHLHIPRSESRGPDPFWSSAELRIEGHKDVSPEKSITTCDVMFGSPQARFAVISDVDDTILHTGVTNIATMAKLTLFGNARTRAPLDGVAKLYEMFQHHGDPAGPPLNPIFYVSSSPWNLYDLLEDFLKLNAIPKGPLLLRDLGFDQNKFLKEGHGHKLAKTRHLIHLYDDLPFVLFGDSGQEDAFLYATAAVELGPRIKAIFIRDIDPDNDSRHDGKVDRHVAQAADAGVPMFRVRDSAEAAGIAVNLGLLPPNAVDDVVAATARDRKRAEGILSP